MILIGMFDCPFVRRVAVSLRLLGVPFQHRNWSVVRDFELIRQFNPLGRVPALVQPDGEPLIDSTAILDFLDGRAGPERALLPPVGDERRRALHIVSLALGAANKSMLLIDETAYGPCGNPWDVASILAARSPARRRAPVRARGAKTAVRRESARARR